jgi:hypothetical protein
MMTDLQTPPSDENIYIRQPDTEIQKVLRRQLFPNMSPFSSNLSKILPPIAETPPGGESNFMRENESIFLIVVCLYFPRSSHSFRDNRVKTHLLQQRRPLAKKIFLMNSPTPTS